MEYHEMVTKFDFSNRLAIIHRIFLCKKMEKLTFKLEIL